MITTDPLSIEAIRRRLSTTLVGQHLYLFGQVESTNKVLRHLARSGAGDGTTVLAETQTHGRGRLGQVWFSPPGVNLYASVLFRAPLTLKQAPVFSLITSLAVADACKDRGAKPAIKWPNDVLIGTRKISGALIECATRGEQVEFVVLGVGVNLNVEPTRLHAELGPAGLHATSLSAALGHDVDRNAFAASYLNHLDAWARLYRSEGPARILAAWRDRDILTGRRVEARGDGVRFDGRVLGVDDDGHVIVRTSAGDRRVIFTEEIRVLD